MKRLLYDINSEKYRAEPGVHKINGWAMYDQHNYDTCTAKCPRCETTYQKVRMHRVRHFRMCLLCEPGARNEGSAVRNPTTDKSALPHSRFDSMTLAGEPMREYSVEMIGDQEDAAACH